MRNATTKMTAESGYEPDISAPACIETALFQLMERKSFRDITVTELCVRAGVTRMSFYRNFESMEDVVRGRIRRITDEWLRKSGISYAEDPAKDYFLELFTHMEEHRELLEQLLKAGLVHLVQEEFTRVFNDVYADTYDPYKTAFHAGGVYSVFLRWLEGGCAETPDEMANSLSGLLEK